jgi:hypothetical protein
MAESVMKNENLKKQFTEDGKVNINKVVENCEIMYTLLEMVNTTEMIRVNESYIKELINSFKA